MHNKIKSFLGLLLIFTFGTVHADCIVTTKNFSKSSRVIYVNPTNGSDQLAKYYNYNLNNLRNPYEPKRIVAFQNINEALATRKTRNGDLTLYKTGSSWTNYDVWSKNKTAEFKVKSAEVSGYSQRQCRGENLTWVPPAVTDTQSAETAPATELSNNRDINVATTELVTPSNPTTNQVAISTLQNTTSTFRSRKSSGGSSSGGSSSGTNSQNNDLDTVTDPQQIITNSTRPSRNQPQNSVADTADLVAGVDPTIIEETGNDSDVPSVENGQNKVDPGYPEECTVYAPWENAIQTYPQDSNGWSIIKPDIETKIVYVSSSEGNDSLAETYNAMGINDPFNPGDVKAYKTIEKAYTQIREGKPDWILLKKGDRFNLNNILWLKSGKSQKSHIVFGSYGPQNAKRPIIETGSNAAIQGNKNRSYVTVVGLEFYAGGLDPTSDKFLGWDVKGGSAFSNVAGTGNYGNFVEGIHLENNRINFYRLGIVIGAAGSANNKNIVIRRNQVLNSYNSHGHSQGIFVSRLNGALIEENVFDHNGWYQQRPSDVPLNTKAYGYATFFNHNVYIENSSNLIIRRNLSSRSSSIGMKFTSNSNSETKIDAINSANILLKDNLIVEGEVGFSIGGNREFKNGYRWNNIMVNGNVLTNIGRTRPTNRNIAFNIEANDWQSGIICSNFISDTSPHLSNVSGIITKGHINNLVIANNNLINLRLNNDLEVASNVEKLTTTNNTYIANIENINFLDSYIKTESFLNYNAYIKSVLQELENNPSSYYDVSKALNYIKSKSKIEKTLFKP